MRHLTVLLAIALGLGFAPRAWGEPSDYFTIQVVDAESGRGVPLVELRTVHGIRCWTDSAGIVAFREPGLMDQPVYFHVRSHGYRYPADGFGFRGVRLQTTPGGQATVKLPRINVAERLYRVTGAGIYRDSLLVGRDVPLQQPLLNAQVVGSDSVQNAVYQGRLYWFWGDTNRAAYPLGNFHVPGAVSRLPSGGGLDPQAGVDLEYFVDEQGFARPTARMPGEGPTWINSLVTLTEEDGRQRLFAGYVKVKPPLTVYRRGLAEWNPRESRFEAVREFDPQAPLLPEGHAFLLEQDGVRYVYFGNPFPLVRVRATPEDLADLTKYEAYTCLRLGSRQDSRMLETRGESPQFRWKPDTMAFTPQLQAELIREGQLKPRDGLFQLADSSGRPVLIHSGSVCWNAFRQRWIMIGLQSFGTSALGEVWYAEAEQPTGPWKYACKIVTHDRYSFYNPKQHAMLDQQGGRIIFFEGTYTATFSGNDDRTPRYDYNQIMYRLDLADPRLHPAEPDAPTATP